MKLLMSCSQMRQTSGLWTPQALIEAILQTVVLRRSRRTALSQGVLLANKQLEAPSLLDRSRMAGCIPAGPYSGIFAAGTSCAGALDCRRGHQMRCGEESRSLKRSAARLAGINTHPKMTPLESLTCTAVSLQSRLQRRRKVSTPNCYPSQQRQRRMSGAARSGTLKGIINTKSQTAAHT